MCTAGMQVVGLYSPPMIVDEHRSPQGRRLSPLDAPQVMLATEENTQWRAAEVMARSMAELVSIVAGGALFSFGKIAGAAPRTPRHGPNQAAHELIFSVQGSVCECARVPGLSGLACSTPTGATPRRTCETSADRMHVSCTAAHRQPCSLVEVARNAQRRSRRGIPGRRVSH